MRKLFFVLISLMLIACEQSGKASYQKAITTSKDSIMILMDRRKIPGLAITVMKDGSVLWSEGFGHADLEQDVHVDPAKTKFRIGSISKALTAAGLAKLYEKQKIILDSSLYFYFPEYTRYKYRPTVRQLAGHLAGVRHYKGNEFYSTRSYPNVVDGLSMFNDDTLLFKPGERFEYTSHGFNLLSAVIEKASHNNFLNFMADEVFKPLYLINTSADKNDSVINNRSKFYEVKNDIWANAPYVDNSYKWAGGGFISSSEDIARFGSALLREDFLKQETVQLFRTPQKLNDGSLTTYGMGFAVEKDFNGKTYFGHSGGSVGGTSDMVIYPDEKIVVVVLTNLSSANLGNITQQIAHFMLEE